MMLEFAGIIIFGILAQWIAWRIKVPAILPLILIGIIIGPISVLFTHDHTKLLEPVWNGTHGLFPGERLYDVVTLAIGIILFEGGLTLKKTEIKSVGNTIIKLITVGSLVTFVCASVSAHFLFEIPWAIAFLFSALIIVTGPTVISPILRNIPLKKEVSTILKWEGILIDPIGALVAVIAYEFITSITATSEFTTQAFSNFFTIVLIGTSVGFSFANFLVFLIKRDKIPHYLLNVISLSFVLMVFVFSDMIAHESGLLAVVIMGMVIGNKNLPNLRDILNFKESLSILLISLLFILLSANIDLEDLELIYRKETVFLLLIVIFMIRPLAVFISSYKSGLKTNEKLFISWVGPRGIVAAGIASLFGQRLLDKGIEGAAYITPLVFIIVLGTVLLNATTARLFAKLSKVYIKNSNDIMIVGATTLSRVIGCYLSDIGRRVVMIDNNINNIQKAKDKGLEAFHHDVLSDDFDQADFNSIGFLLAMTPNNVINKNVLDKHKDEFGENGYYRLMSVDEYLQKENYDPTHLLSSYGDFDALSKIARDYPTMNEIIINNRQDVDRYLSVLDQESFSTPLFIKQKSTLHPLNSKTILDRIIISEDQPVILVYIGKEIKK